MVGLLRDRARCTLCVKPVPRLHRHSEREWAVPSGTLDAIYFVTLGEHGYRCDCPHGEHVRWFDEARCEHVKAVRQFVAFERARVRVVCSVGPELLEEENGREGAENRTARVGVERRRRGWSWWQVRRGSARILGEK